MGNTDKQFVTAHDLNITNTSKDGDAPGFNDGIFLDVDSYLDTLKLDDGAVPGNYKYTLVTRYDVIPAKLDVDIAGTKVYGEATSADSGNYIVTIGGLMNGETLDDGTVKFGNGTYDKIAGQDVTNVAKDGDAAPYNANGYLDVGQYDNTATLDSLYRDNAANGYKAKNYEITETSTYTVTPKELNFIIEGTKVYGQVTSTNGTDYKVTVQGLENGETVGSIGNGIGQTGTGMTMTNVSRDSDPAPFDRDHFLDVGQYDNTVTIDDVERTQGGYKKSNYTVTQTSSYVVDPAELNVIIEGNKIFGQDTSTSGSDYVITIGGLVNGETVDGFGNQTGSPSYLTVNDSAVGPHGETGKYLPVGIYTDTLTLEQLQYIYGGFKKSNYVLKQTSRYQVLPNDDPQIADARYGGWWILRKPELVLRYLNIHNTGMNTSFVNDDEDDGSDGAQ